METPTYLNASLSSSSLSVSFIFFAIIRRNSSKSIVPLPAIKGSNASLPRKEQGSGYSPSASTSLIMSCNSDSVGFCPSDRITVPSSLVVIFPSPFLSNREKASRNSVKRTGQIRGFLLKSIAHYSKGNCSFVKLL